MKNNGFSLIEISIVLVIAGLLLSGLLSFYRAYLGKDKINTTRANIESVDEAISRYVERYNRLPCPAPLDAAPDAEAYGAPMDCAEILKKPAIVGGDQYVHTSTSNLRGSLSAVYLIGI